MQNSSVALVTTGYRRIRIYHIAPKPKSSKTARFSMRREV